MGRGSRCLRLIIFRSCALLTIRIRVGLVRISSSDFPPCLGVSVVGFVLVAACVDLPQERIYRCGLGSGGQLAATP